MTKSSRQPTAFVLDDSTTAKPQSPAKSASPAKRATKPQSRNKTATKKRIPKALPMPEINFEEPDFDNLEHSENTADMAFAARAEALNQKLGWGALLFSCVISLLLMMASLSFWNLIEDLFAKSPLFGWLASGLVALAILALAVISLSEIIGIWRLQRLGSIKMDANNGLEGDEKAARKAISQLTRLYKKRPEMRLGLDELRSHQDHIMSPKERLQLVEHHLMAPLDEQAGSIIAHSARRVMVLTAITPAALLDIALVAVQNLRMLREIATLYGGRPHSLGTFRLARMVITHLAVTGGLALTDGVIQGVIGKTILGKLSSRLGEGAINGVLTARIGLAAIDLLRPMAFSQLEKPGLAKFSRDLFSLSPKRETD